MKDRQVNKEGGLLFYGTKGKLYNSSPYGISPRLIPEEAMQNYQRPAEKFPGADGNFIDAALGGKPAGANFVYAQGLVELMLLGPGPAPAEE